MFNKVALTLLGVLVTGSGSFVYHTAQRVSTLEAHREDDSARLDRIESKIDKLLERGNADHK